MIRFLFRLLATFALAIAVIMAVLDATRSIARLASGAHAAGRELGMRVARHAAVSPRPWCSATSGRRFWDPGMTFVLAQPGFAVFAALALIFYVIGHKPRRPARLRRRRLIVKGGKQPSGRMPAQRTIIAVKPISRQTAR